MGWKRYSQPAEGSLPGYQGQSPWLVLLVVVFVAVCAIPKVRAEERMRVVLDIGNGAVTAPSVLAAALAEARSIWAANGVAIETATCSADADEQLSTLVPVTFESARAHGHVPSRSAPLGWTRFAPTGEPAQISIFYDVISIAARGSVLFGVRGMHATVMQERLLARVLGRTLAHEVGHVVLRSTEHSSSGLMRAAQPIEELQHPDRAGFDLDQRDVARLQQLLVQRARALTLRQ